MGVENSQNFKMVVKFIISARYNIVSFCKSLVSNGVCNFVCILLYNLSYVKLHTGEARRLSAYCLQMRKTHGQFANVRQMAEKRRFRRYDFIGGGKGHECQQTPPYCPSKNRIKILASFRPSQLLLCFRVAVLLSACRVGVMCVLCALFVRLCCFWFRQNCVFPKR